MEKYGVNEDIKPEEKQASVLTVTRCPWCGADCRVHGAILLCPTHGSKPFERDDDTAK